MSNEAQQHASYRHTTSSERGVICTQDDCPLTLEGTAVTVETFWDHARVSIKQEYSSMYPRSVSAFAAFNAGPGWELMSFRCDINDQSFYTKLDKMKIEPVRTTILEPPIDMCTVKIPIPFHTGHSATVTTIFLTKMLVTPEEVEFQLPKVMLAAKADGASSEWKKSFNVINSGRKLSPKITFEAKGSLLNACENVPSVPSSLCGAVGKIMGNPKNYSVAYQSKDGELNLSSDEGITYGIKTIPDEDPVTIQLLREEADHVSADDKYVCAVSLTPNLDSCAGAPNVELVVALDASASMSPYVDSVTASLRSMAKGLPTSCFFNCVTFGSSTKWLFPNGSEQVSAGVLDGWNEFLTSEYDASQDQTRIYTAIQDIYQMPTIRGYVRIVLLVTDGGEPKIPARAAEICASNTHSTRLACVGLGASCDEKFLRNLASCSRGIYLPAPKSELVQSVMVDILSEVLVPTMVEVNLKFSYDGIDEVPPLRNCSNTFSVIPANTRSIFYALGNETLRGCTATVFGNVAGQHYEYKIHSGELDPAVVDKTLSTIGNAATVSIAHAAAAVQRIYTLVNENPKPCLSKAENEEVARLSTQFSVPSPNTNHQLCDKSGTVIDTEGKLVIAPYVLQRARFIMPPMPPVRDASGGLVDADKHVLQQRAIKAQQVASAAASHAAAISKAGTGVTTAGFMRGVVGTIVDAICAPGSISKILQSQELDGSWPVCHTVVSAIPRTTEEFLQAKPTNVNDSVWATAVMQLIVDTRCSEQDKSQAKLALKKAQAFLAQHGEQGEEAADAASKAFSAAA